MGRGFHHGEHGDHREGRRDWIPAFAGMTVGAMWGGKGRNLLHGVAFCCISVVIVKFGGRFCVVRRQGGFEPAPTANGGVGVFIVVRMFLDVKEGFTAGGVEGAERFHHREHRDHREGREGGFPLARE